MAAPGDLPRAKNRGADMGDDDTVYCNVQKPVAQVKSYCCLENQGCRERTSTDQSAQSSARPVCSEGRKLSGPVAVSALGRSLNRQTLPPRTMHSV